MLPAVTDEVKDAAQLAALQLETYFFCVNEEACGMSWTHFRLSRFTVTACVEPVWAGDSG